MAYNQKKIEIAEKMFEVAIQLIKENAYCVPADEVPTANAIATLIGKNIKWDCIDGQDVAYNVLEEVNEHTLAKNFKELADHHNRTFDLEQV